MKETKRVNMGVDIHELLRRATAIVEDEMAFYNLVQYRKVALVSQG